MKHVFRNNAGARQTVIRDTHNPTVVGVKTETNDAAVIAHNKRIRSAEVLPQDSRNPAVEGDIIAFAFQFPTVMDYTLTARAEPDLFHRIEQGGDDGLRAAESLSLLYPQFVTTTKRGDVRR